MTPKLLIILLVFFIPASVAHAAAPNLRAYYSFDSNFTDSSGNNNHLTTAAGTPTITTTKGEFAIGGGALDLDSTTLTQEYLDLTSPITFTATDAWSVAFWGRRRPGTNVSSGMVLGNPANTTDFIWLTDNATQVQGLRFRSSDNTNANFGTYPDDGLFHHWVVISDGAGTIFAYRDNVAQTSVATTGSFSITSVGQAYNSTLQSMDGQIDELYIYDGAISAAKVNELYTAGVTRLRVFLLGGQSNADGRAVTTDLPTIPVNLQQPQNDVDLFYKIEGGTATLTTLRPGLSETSQFGPEITLGRSMANLWAVDPGTRVAIIKYANGGTNLQIQWKAGGDGTITGDGAEYVTFQQTVQQGLAALAAAYPSAAIDLQGMVWMQGESDAVSSYENSYQTNITQFITDVRATYTADLPFIIGRLSIYQTNIAAETLGIVRAAQTAVAAALPRVSMIDTDPFGIKTDNLHFNASGQQALGNASAGALISYVPFTSPPTSKQLGNGDIEITVANVFPEYLYTLANSGTLLPDNWSDGDSETATGTTITLTYTPGIGETKRFFRVKRSPAP